MKILFYATGFLLELREMYRDGIEDFRTKREQRLEDEKREARIEYFVSGTRRRKNPIETSRWSMNLGRRNAA